MTTRRTLSQRPLGHQSTSQVFDPVYTSDDESEVSTEEEQDPTYTGEEYSSDVDYLEDQDEEGENDAVMGDLEEEVVDVVADDGIAEIEDMGEDDLGEAESSDFEWALSSRSRSRTSTKSNSKLRHSAQPKSRQRSDKAGVNRSMYVIYKFCSMI
jgi:hypothetical protein